MYSWRELVELYYLTTAAPSNLYDRGRYLRRRKPRACSNEVGTDSRLVEKAAEGDAAGDV
jgi:hypothetical protein